MGESRHIEFLEMGVPRSGSDEDFDVVVEASFVESLSLPVVLLEAQARPWLLSLIHI